MSNATLPRIEIFLSREPVASAIVLLEERCPSHLCFHTIEHTLDVLREAYCFASHEGVGEYDMETLCVAAVFHDFGFLESKAGEEEIAVRYAQESLEHDKNFSKERVEEICRLILDTKLAETERGLEQKATHPLSVYLLDADLSNLGRPDFFDCTKALCKEKGMPLREGAEQALSLMQRHIWQTQIAHTLREEQKRKNMEFLEQFLK